MLRIDPRLHATLREAASRSGLSLNEYCARKLAGAGLGGTEPAWAAVERASSVVGNDLLGVVIYGSWARGEATERSDVDVLIVVDPGRPIVRDLYRLWDEEPVLWSDPGAGREQPRRVEPHFVHLPPIGEVPSGTWAEVALDGVVILDPALVVSRRLVDLRRSIFDGDLVRHEVHGQPYWAEAR